jgi:hypothetical protein
MSEEIPAPIKRQKVEEVPIGKHLSQLVKSYPPLVREKLYQIDGNEYASYNQVNVDLTNFLQNYGANVNNNNVTGILDANGIHVDMRPSLLKIILGLIGRPGCQRMESYGCTAQDGNAMVTAMGLTQNAVLGIRSADQLTTRLTAFAKSMGLLHDDGTDHVILATDIATNVQIAVQLSPFTNTISNNASMVAKIATTLNQNRGGSCCSEFTDALCMNMGDTGLKQYDWICEHVALHPCTRDPSTKKRITGELIQVGAMLKYGLANLVAQERAFFNFIFTKNSKRSYVSKHIAPICTRIAELCHGANNPGFYSAQLTSADEEFAQSCFAMSVEE